MGMPVRHATEKWVGEQITAALAAYVPPDGGGSSAAASSPVLTSPNGTRWRQVADDQGFVTTVQTLEPGPPATPSNLVLEDS